MSAIVGPSILWWRLGTWGVGMSHKPPPATGEWICWDVLGPESHLRRCETPKGRGHENVSIALAADVYAGAVLADWTAGGGLAARRVALLVDADHRRWALLLC